MELKLIAGTSLWISHFCSSIDRLYIPWLIYENFDYPLSIFSNPYLMEWLNYYK
jgi:hypothetical protein